MTDALNRLPATLIAWFEKNRRDLPWRRDREPYHVWISEIMLQQTRIEAVVPCYSRFMDALPDVKALSEVDDDALMKLWEGLGYYSRARNLKKAARQIMTEHGGVFPSTYADLRKLAGIGEYTAGAIASICFNERVPAVDGNVLRVITRVIGSSENVLLPETKKHISALLSEVIPAEAGAFNEGLMELGERVCLPNGAPDCGSCPLSGLCTAHQKGLTAELPVRVKTTKRTHAEKSVFLITAPDGRLAIEKRPDQGLLAGLFQLPNIDGFHTDAELTEILEGWGLKPEKLTFIKDAKHVFTHIDWFMKGYRVGASNTTARFIWATEEELRERYSLPTAFRKLLK